MILHYLYLAVAASTKQSKKGVALAKINFEGKPQDPFLAPRTGRARGTRQDEEAIAKQRSQ